MLEIGQKLEEQGVREGVEAPHHQESVAEDLEIKECLSSQSSYSNEEEEGKHDQKEVIP